MSPCVRQVALILLLALDVSSFFPLNPLLVGAPKKGNSALLSPPQSGFKRTTSWWTRRGTGGEVGEDEVAAEANAAANANSAAESDTGESTTLSTTTAKELLSRYGVAYLATSIPLAALSFALCYLLVSSGFPVDELLQKINIEVNANSETATNVAVAYAIHKATSPIRFIPTVALTPIVAKVIGGKEGGEE